MSLIVGCSLIYEIHMSSKCQRDLNLPQISVCSTSFIKQLGLTAQKLNFVLPFNNPISYSLQPSPVTWFVEMFCIDFHRQTVSWNVGHSHCSDIFNKADEGELQSVHYSAVCLYVLGGIFSCFITWCLYSRVFSSTSLCICFQSVCADCVMINEKTLVGSELSDQRGRMVWDYFLSTGHNIHNISDVLNQLS